MVHRRKCAYCDGWLVAVGHDRANGKDHPDWATRMYHKKCFKKRPHLNYKFKFGKYKGQYLFDVIHSDLQYVKWACTIRTDVAFQYK